jgi:hypothetical protein
MAVGLSATNLANAWLNTMRGGGAGSNFTAPANLYVQLHTGDPGASGTSAVSSTTARSEVTFAAASAGSMSASNTPSWATWAGTNGEVVTHISVWSASSAGTFYFSAALSASKTLNTGDTLNLTSLTFALTPVAV